MTRLIALSLVVVFAACGVPAQSVEQPSPTPIVVTQIVVVTATTPPATETPEPSATPTRKPTATPRPTATVKPTPVTGKWQTDKDTSSFDDTKKVVLYVDAEADISGPVGNYRPSLVLRCQEGETEAYVVVGMQADVEGVSDTATVRMRFDQEPATTAQAGKSTSGEALFLQAALIETMLKHEQFVFGFTPFSADPVEMTFDIRGLAEAIKPLREACP